MNKKLKYLLTSILATVMIFCFVACGGSKKANFKLDQTSLTVNVGESAGLIVTKDKEEYYGPISWVSGDDMVATVSQRIVTGVRAGQVVVRAVINYEGETYELSCDVTVKAVVSADLNMISGYLGAGDITITATAAEIPTGATAKAVKLTSPSGKDCSNLLKTVGTNEVVANSFENPLEEGIYTVTYDLKTIDASSQTTRQLRIVKAESVNDILVLDAIDGTERISGKVMENNYEPGYGAWLDKELGEYVTYNENGNTGYTEENGINQNLSEFKKSLEDAGYNGNVDNATVYRMYAKKKTTVGKALYFVFNLPYTSNSIWTNLNAVPNGATIDVWVRFWFRPTGYDEYVLAEAGGAYAYKVISGGASVLSSAGYSPKWATDSWGKISWQIDNNRELLNGAKNLAFTVPFNKTYITNPETGVREYVNLTGDVYCELYSVELGISEGDVMSNFTGIVEKEFFGMHTGLFDSVEVSISKDGEPIEYNEGDKLAVGLYDITYTLKNGDSVYDVVNKKLQVNAIDKRTQNYLIPDTTNYYFAMHSGNTSGVALLNGLTSHGGADISQKPIGATGDYNSCIYVTPGDNMWETGVAFDISDILANIDEYEDKDLTLWVASYFYGERGAFLTKASTTQGRAVGISKEKYDTGGMSMGILSSGSTNGWRAIKISISTLKEAYQDSPSSTHILYGFRTNMKTPVYIYALEVTEKEKTEEVYLPDGTNHFYSAHSGNTIETAYMQGLTSHGGADISEKPVGAKEEYTSCVKLTPGANHWETAVGFDISDILANIDEYENYKLTLYVASYFYGSRGVYLTTFNESQGRVTGISQTEYNTGGITVNVPSGSTGGWVAINVPISDIKEASENKPGANYILFALRTNEKTPVYVYSLELTEPKPATYGSINDIDTIGGATGVSNHSWWSDGKNVSLVEASTLTDTIGIPSGTSYSADKKVLKVTGKGSTGDPSSCVIGVVIKTPELAENINAYNNNDYISLWVYVPTPAKNNGVLDQQLLWIANGSIGNAGVSYASITTNITVDSWCQLTVTIGELKALAQEKGINMISDLYFTCRFFSADQEVFVYGLEICKGE